MTRHLCISVTLLDPLFHGKGDGDEPEWPPSPMRLFQALVAGSHAGCHNGRWSEADDDPLRSAFRWLERRDPPLIIGPAAVLAQAYTLFVPNNDSDKKLDRQARLTSKIVRSYRMANCTSGTEADQTLYYVWAIPEDEWIEARAHAELVYREARHLIALGWGIDHAVADGRILTDAEAAALPGQWWRPRRTHRPGQRQSRVPTADSLEDLEAVHMTFVTRINGRLFNPPRKLRRFDSAVYMNTAALPPRPYAAFELPEGIVFRQEDAVAVAAMMRSLACRCAKTDSHSFPGGSTMYVAGHTKDNQSLRTGPTPPRFSYLPLPTIGHAHADGMIRRMLIADPFGADGPHARWAQARLRNQILRDHDGNERGVLLDPWRRRSAAMLSRYTSESTSWSSVTPLILPGFDDGKLDKRDRLVLKAIAQAGLSAEALESFTLRKAPYWAGSQHPRQYRRPNYLQHYPAWHMHVRFRRPISGPLAIGAGRHCGLGVLAVDDRS